MVPLRTRTHQTTRVKSNIRLCRGQVRAHLALACLFLSVQLVGCSSQTHPGGHPGSATATRIQPTVQLAPVGPTSPESTPGGTPAGFYPRGTRTGIPELDRVLDATFDGDVDRLLSLVRLSSYVCTVTPRPISNDVKCPEGVPDATVVQAFPVGSYRVGWALDPPAVRQALSNLVSRPSWVYRIEQVPFDGPGQFIGAVYFIVLGERVDTESLRVYVDAADGALVQIAIQGGPPTAFRREDATPILPPLP